MIVILIASVRDHWFVEKITAEIMIKMLHQELIVVLKKVIGSSVRCFPSMEFWHDYVAVVSEVTHFY